MLLFGILIASWREAVQLVVFKAAQSEIVEKWCVNREQPEKHCNGKCYLSQKMQESHDKDDNRPTSAFLNFESKIVFMMADPLPLLFREVLQPPARFSHLGLLSFLFPVEILHPPEFVS